MGYFNDEVMTQKVLLSNGWMHTGDLGYIDKEGFLNVTGRKISKFLHKQTIYCKMFKTVI